MSRGLFIKMSVLTLVVVMMIITSLTAGDLLARTFAVPQGVILKGDPAIVAKTIAEAQPSNSV